MSSFSRHLCPIKSLRFTDRHTISGKKTATKVVLCVYITILGGFYELRAVRDMYLTDVAVRV